MDKLSTQPTKGFHDIYPEDMRVRQWLFGKMRETAMLFGFEEYDGPILEPIEIYAAKSGEELVKQQTFLLTDRGGRQVALRPELTPTLARMVACKKNQLTYPLRWFSIGPRFRYEAPQKGRAREFYQFDCDLVGPTTPESDAEIIALAATFFKNLGLTPDDVVIKINSRKMLQHKLSLLDIPSSKTNEVIHAIDKKDKMSEDKWIEYLKTEDLSDDQIKNLLKIMGDRDVSFESDELTNVFSTLKDLGVSEYVEFDPSIVRGLEYYTGTVFEARDKKGQFRALLGGGRYDNLVELFSKESLSGIGFACGDMVLLEMLSSHDLLPNTKSLSSHTSRILVTVFNESTVRASLKLIRTLRDEHIPSELYPDFAVRLDKQIKYADKKGIEFVVIIGPDEMKNDTLTLKNLKTGEQKTITFHELLSLVQ
jgi:histidyl-tRNA synthetase